MPLDVRENVLDFNGGCLSQRGLFWALLILADHGSVILKNMHGHEAERTFTEWKEVLKLIRDVAN